LYMGPIREECGSLRLDARRSTPSPPSPRCPMLQLDNRSPFAATMFGFPEADGVDTLLVVVKGSFSLGPPMLLAEPRPVVLADEYRGEPGASSLVHATEAHLRKVGTDVVVVGEACTPGERPATAVDVGLGISGQQVQARVYGERYWTERIGGVRPSAPKEFLRIPVCWERAYGGCHVPDPESDRYLAEPRNPVGRGFLGKRRVRHMLGEPVPNIEDPRQPIGELGRASVPVGFGPIPPSWEPRCGFAGTYDKNWQEHRAPYLPADFDRRFLNVAPPPLVFREPLEGGERVALVGFHPCGTQRFDLPRCELQLRATVAGVTVELPYLLETVVLEPTEERLSLTWRGWLRADKRMLAIEQVEVELLELSGAQPP
jgi:hypothetical protein